MGTGEWVSWVYCVPLKYVVTDELPTVDACRATSLSGHYDRSIKCNKVVAEYKTQGCSLEYNACLPRQCHF